MIVKDSQYKPQGGEETLNLIPGITHMEKLQALGTGLGKESMRGRDLRDVLKAAVLRSEEPKPRARRSKLVSHLLLLLAAGY